MPWTAVAGAVVGSVVSSALAPSGSTSPTGAAAAADPFAAQRSQYQTQLSNMMTPGAVFNSSDPSYAFRFQQGADSLNRQQNATGNMGSGAEMAAATTYGQNMASQEYANQFSRLSQLAGANIGSPAAAGQILSGAGQQQQGGATALGGAIGNAAGTAFGNWMNTPSQAQQQQIPYASAGSNTNPVAVQSSNYGLWQP